MPHAERKTQVHFHHSRPPTAKLNRTISFSMTDLKVPLLLIYTRPSYDWVGGMEKSQVPGLWNIEKCDAWLKLSCFIDSTIFHSLPKLGLPSSILYVAEGLYKKWEKIFSYTRMTNWLPMGWINPPEQFCLAPDVYYKLEWRCENGLPTISSIEKRLCNLFCKL